MHFHIEERLAWLRSSTHTLVLDRDPDFTRFANDPTGCIKRMLRIWLAGTESGPRVRAYLGTVGFCATGPSLGELRRAFRRASRCASMIEEPAFEIRRGLSNALRERLGQRVRLGRVR
jgi:hypothetical protein